MATKNAEIDLGKFNLIKNEIAATLPSSWILSTLGESFRWGSGGTPKSDISEYYDNGEIPWLIIGDLDDGVINSSVSKITSKGLNNSSAKLVEPGTILVAMYGSIGKLGIAGKPLATNQAIAFAYKNEIYPLYLFYFLMRVRSSLISFGKGATQLNISQTVIKAFPFVIAPLDEQYRIVSKIEELFSELDKGVENLLLSHQQIKAYRQSLLKHAFEGGLTAEWRGRNLEVLEDIDLMFKRIELERQKSNQQKIADWESRGKIGSKPKLSKSLPPMSSDELANLPKLSKGWGWVRYGNLCSFIRNGISSKPEGATGTPIFRISAVRPLIFDMTDIRHIDNKDGIFDSYYLERGDLVFTRYNGSRHYVGVCAEYRSDEKRLFPDKLVQTRVFSKEISTSYLERALNSGCSRAFVETKIRTTAGQSGISGDDIRNIPVPICSYEEQILINSELESRLSKVDELIKVIDSALHQSASLRQSILKKAFSGQLVPQDPNDEPASKLLERIKAEVANSKPIRKKKAA